MSFRRAVGFLLMMIAGVLPSSGQTRPFSRHTFSIEGTVRDDYDQHTLENIRVDLKQSTGILVKTTFTGGNGDFEFSGVPKGDYTIEIVLPDYQPFRDTVSVFNSKLQGFSIFLRRSTTVASTSSQGSVSVHLLSAPRKAREEFERGLYLLYSKSDYRGAITQFQHAIKDFPNFYEAYAEEGGAYFNLKEIAAAEESMRKSVDSARVNILRLFSSLLHCSTTPTDIWKPRLFLAGESRSTRPHGMATSSWRERFRRSSNQRRPKRARFRLVI